MRKILDGVREFQTQVFPRMRTHFEALARGQKPEAVFITCSDSRVHPNLITSTAPGELFIIRNAGNIVPPPGSAQGSEAGTIEHAVGVLQVRNVIVCGHYHCGAMEALFGADSREADPTAEWLRHAEATRRITRRKHPQASGTELFDRAVEENVLVQMKHLETHPVVAEALATRSLQIHGWTYRMETGEVLAFDPLAGAFVPLETLSRHGHGPHPR